MSRLIDRFLEYVKIDTQSWDPSDTFPSTMKQKDLAVMLVEELNKISHREYSTGFYLGGEPGQVYANGGYVREYQVIGVAQKWSDGVLVLSQRNRFFCGDTIEILEPGGEPFSLTISSMENEKGESIQSAPHATMEVHIPVERPVSPGALLRKAKE